MYFGDRGAVDIEGGMSYVEGMGERNHRNLVDCFEFYPVLSSHLESSHFRDNYSHFRFLDSSGTERKIVKPYLLLGLLNKSITHSVSRKLSMSVLAKLKLGLKKSSGR